MRVLIVSQYFWPESFRINEVVESLRQAGCTVAVLTGQPNYPDGKIYSGYSPWASGRHDHVDGYPIYRVAIVPRGSGKAWRLALNYLSFAVSASIQGRWLLRGQHFDVILVYGMSPIFQAIPGIFLKRPMRAALVTWVQDLWPESIAVAGFVRNRWVLSCVGTVVKWIYRSCDLLLVQSRAFVPIVESMAEAVPVRYHPNPGELPSGETSEGTESGVTLEAGFNVVFAGNLGTVQALDTVLDAAERLAEYRDIHIVLVGSGSRRDWLVQEAAARKLSNVRFVARLPPQAMPSVFAQASALLVSLVRSPAMSNTIPSKVQAYLAAGRPIIASLDGEGARVISEAGAGLTCAAEDAAALAHAILRMRGMSGPELLQMGDAGRWYYRQHFDPVTLAQRLVEHFRDLHRGDRSQDSLGLG
ncbi:MAG TPA: glycosyltransferase family 4 protein [Steroidobacteraceae bacterium]|nr:glycosyltransferase family 4 protein [Steroidobacteraceae bacterium]